MIEKFHVKHHDQEWVNLMKEAKELGLNVEEVRQILEEVAKQGNGQKD